MNKRNYELMLVLSPELDENALEALIDRIKRFLDNAEAEVFSFKSWGLRRLAYIIQRQREGRYYIVYFSCETENCSELERNLILTEGILRHLLTRAEQISVEEPVVVDDIPVAEPVVVDDIPVAEPVVVDDIPVAEPVVTDDQEEAVEETAPPESE